MSTLFIQITPETSLYTIASNLTKMQYRLWLFLYHLDPFGDRPVLIPTPTELAAQLNMSVRSIQRALKKLSELGLFTIRSTYQRAITNGIKNKPINSKHYRQRVFNQNDKNVAVTTKMSSTTTKLAQPRQKCRQQSPQPNTGKDSISPQTNTDYVQTLSDIEGDKNINSIANSQELVDYWFENNICNSSSIATKDPGKGSIAPRLEQLNENKCSNNSREDRTLVTLDNAANTGTNDSNVVTSNCSNLLPDKDYNQIELVKLPNNSAPSVNTTANVNGSNVITGNCSNPLPDKDYSQIELVELPNNSTPSVNTAPLDTNVVTTLATVISINNSSNGVIVNSTQTNQDFETRSNANLFSWLTPGPWNIEGKLDPNFRDWLAKDWISRYGGTIHQRRADVLSHFQNKPAMLPVRWEQYQNEYVDRYRNAQTRMTNGMSIDPTEQQQLIEHTNAVSKPLPAAMSPVRKKSGVRSQESGVNSTEPILQSKIIGVNNKLISTSSTNENRSHPKKLPTTTELLTPDRLPENAENPDAYKLFSPRAIDPKAGLELLKEAFTIKKPLAISKR